MQLHKEINMAFDRSMQAIVRLEIVGVHSILWVSVLLNNTDKISCSISTDHPFKLSGLEVCCTTELK